MSPKAILLHMQPEQEIINRWTGSAPYWEKHREVIRQMFAPVTQALAEDGRIGTGQVVLDVATGPGEPALTMAGLVGADGRVFGIDPIPEMVAAARRAEASIQVDSSAAGIPVRSSSASQIKPASTASTIRL